MSPRACAPVSPSSWRRAAARPFLTCRWWGRVPSWRPPPRRTPRPAGVLVPWRRLPGGACRPFVVPGHARPGAGGRRRGPAASAPSRCRGGGRGPCPGGGRGPGGAGVSRLVCASAPWSRLRGRVSGDGTRAWLAAGLPRLAVRSGALCPWPLGWPGRGARRRRASSRPAACAWGAPVVCPGVLGRRPPLRSGSALPSSASVRPGGLCPRGAAGRARLRGAHSASAAVCARRSAPGVPALLGSRLVARVPARVPSPPRPWCPRGSPRPPRRPRRLVRCGPGRPVRPGAGPTASRPAPSRRAPLVRTAPATLPGRRRRAAAREPQRDKTLILAFATQPGHPR